MKKNKRFILLISGFIICLIFIIIYSNQLIGKYVLNNASYRYDNQYCDIKFSYNIQPHNINFDNSSHIYSINDLIGTAFDSKVYLKSLQLKGDYVYLTIIPKSNWHIASGKCLRYSKVQSNDNTNDILLPDNTVKLSACNENGKTVAISLYEVSEVYYPDEAIIASIKKDDFLQANNINITFSGFNLLSYARKQGLLTLRSIYLNSN